MTKSLSRLQFPLLRASRSTFEPIRPRCVQYLSSFPEGDASVNSVDAEKSKKCSVPAKKTLAERILTVYEKIAQRKTPPELRRGDGLRSTDPTRVEIEIINVAEQRISQSILRGEFEKLPGKGKPIKIEGNPHADPVEDLAYRILAKNGFAPEWVELNKEIRLKIRRWRKALELAWQKKLESDSCGVAQPEDLKWESLLPKFDSELREINQKIFRYNLLVPFGRQLMCYKLEREIKILQTSEKQNEMSAP
ncbi:hypothetical protein R1sor_019774 [Riccia sorocarpa]|uniref:DnaJ homologue subfamily C member 28 conserved domain-containing protein n=1 Tax=Riccia sorocarpa TaxID=122646 RepID=A0ABD3IG68_9MARC